jgi:hypothetical protein
MCVTSPSTDCRWICSHVTFVTLAETHMEYSPVSNFMKIHPVGFELFYEYKKADGRSELNKRSEGLGKH